MVDEVSCIERWMRVGRQRKSGNNAVVRLEIWTILGIDEVTSNFERHHKFFFSFFMHKMLIIFVFFLVYFLLFSVIIVDSILYRFGDILILDVND